MQRILQVVTSLERGGIELWLMQVLRSADPARYQIDFLVLDQDGALAPEARRLGSRVVTSPEPKKLWRVWRDFATVLRAQGPYDVVHGHMHHYNGLVLRMAAWHGVPCRVAHSHNDTRVVEQHPSWRRRCYLELMTHWIRRFATHRIAVSREAAEDLFGASWAAERNCQIVYCGLDLAPFAAIGDRAETLADLGLPDDALVIGHVGRFHWRKNHAFLLEIAAEAFAREPRARLLCLGDGPLMDEIELRAKAMGIAERIVFAGSRADVPMLMTTAMDVFVLPSHHEGLSLASLEAQAAGLACVLADGLTREGDVVPQLIRRLPLSAPAAEWAAMVLAVAGQPRMRSEMALATLGQSHFAIERSVERIRSVYDSGGQLKSGRAPRECAD